MHTQHTTKRSLSRKDPESQAIRRYKSMVRRKKGIKPAKFNKRTGTFKQVQ